MMSKKTNISMRKLSASMFFALSLMGLAGDVNAMMLDLTPDSLNLTKGEVTMFIPDIPNVPPQDAPVMIAQANQAQASDTTTVRTIGVCFPVPNNNYSGANVIDPVLEAGFYVQQYENRKFDFEHPSGTVTILQQPTHGILRLVTEADIGTILISGSGPIDPANPGYFYLPEQGYLGKDSATLLVDIGGVKVKVKYYFHAVDGLPGSESDKIYCGKTGLYWKISSNLSPNGTSTITAVDYQTPATVATSTPATNAATLTSVLGTSLASSLDANTSGITLNIANLPSGAVGQTTGTNITLDTNAAGYGWYIDPNPAANTDFLPTSNPNVWMAKVGSAAAGKMDMLSVLLHEYGHALGLDHSANPNDFMAPDLQPGERRLPSAAELTLMSQLAAQLNNVSANATGTATLKNSTGTNAQLAQAFNITSQDRYLEFTVSNGLQN